MANRNFHPAPPLGRRSQRGTALPRVFFGFLAIAGFFFFTEHRAHVMGALPFVLLALCPVMHLFHGGHGGHGRGRVRGHQGHGSTGDADGGPASPPATPAGPRLPHQ